MLELQRVVEPCTKPPYGFVFVCEKTPECWVKTLGLDDDTINIIPRNWGWADIAVSLGLFTSKTQAIKNGWGGFPSGFEIRKTKKHGTLWVNRMLERHVSLYERYKK